MPNYKDFENLFIKNATNLWKNDVASSFSGAVTLWFHTRHMMKFIPKESAEKMGYPDTKLSALWKLFNNKPDLSLHFRRISL